MIEPADLLVKPVRNFEPDAIIARRSEIEFSYLWPADVRGEHIATILCDLCERPIAFGGRVVGYPSPTRAGFAVHAACWQRCAERLGKLLELYA